MRFIIILFLSVCSAAAHAAEITSPKIGLALAGGGARGMAHVGALRALEELRVPVHCIAGTSMGSIVGGLYAGGLTVEQLESLALDLDWDAMFAGAPPREQLTYREKQDQRRFAPLEMGWGEKGLSAPGGFLASHKLFLALRRLTRGIQTDDFSRLPIPFKTVATDINAAEAYVLDQGDLALALRASMAVPFAFAPVVIDDRLLVDGGVLNNIPVDLVQSMGADLIVVINIETPLEAIEAESSFIQVAKQTIYAALLKNSLEALKHADIVLTPDLEGFSAADFAKGEEMIERGYAAVMERADLFRALALDEQAYAAYRAAIEAQYREPSPTITPAFVEFEGARRTARALLEHHAGELAGRKLDIAAIEAAVQRLMDLRDFSQVNYRIEKGEQGRTGLVFQIREKPWGPHYFRFGLNLRSSFDDQAEFSLVLQHLRRNLNSLGGEWINTLTFGDEYGLRTEVYQPLERTGRIFATPYLDLQRRFVEIFESGEGLGKYELNRLSGGAELGLNFRRYAVFAAGLRHDWVDAHLQIGDPEHLFSGSFAETLGTLRFGYDTLNDRVFATRGTRVTFDGEIHTAWLGSEHEYFKTELEVRRIFPVDNRVSLWADASLFSFPDSSPPAYETFMIGGVQYLAGYPEGDIGGRQAMVLQLSALYNPKWLSGFGLGAGRLLAGIHAGNAWDRWGQVDLQDLLYGGSGALVWDTALGTVLLGSGYTQGGSGKVFLSIGNQL